MLIQMSWLIFYQVLLPFNYLFYITNSQKNNRVLEFITAEVQFQESFIFDSFLIHFLRNHSRHFQETRSASGGAGERGEKKDR